MLQVKSRQYWFFLFCCFVLLQPVSYAQKNHFQKLQTKLQLAKTNTEKVSLLDSISIYFKAHSEFDKAIKYATAAKEIAHSSISISHNPQEIKALKSSLANTLNNLGELYMYKSEYSIALEKFNEAVTIQIAISDSMKMAEVFNNIGYAYAKKAQYSDAFEILGKAVKIHNKYKNKDGLAIAYNNLGLVYWNQSDFPNALDNFFKALKIFEETGNKTRLAKCYNNIGNINFNQKNYSQALKYYFISLKYAEELGNKIDIGYVNNNIGMIYARQQKNEEAIKYFEKSLEICLEIGDKEGIGTSYLNLGAIYQEQGKMELASGNFQKATRIYESIGDDAGAIYANLAIGDVEMLNKNLSSALVYFSKALELAKKTKNRDEEKNIYQRLAQIYLLKQDYKNAYRYQQMFIDTNDSLFNTEKSRLITEMDSKYEAEKQQKEIVLLSKEKELKEADIKRKALQRNALIISLLLLVLFLVFVFRNFNSKKKANVLLEEKNASISKQKLIIEEKNKELEKLSIVASETGNGVFITDADGEIIWFNEGFSKLFGWKSLDEYAQCRGSNILTVSANENITDLIKSCVEQKRSIEYENATPDKNGNELWIKTTLTPIFDEAGKLKQMVFVETDVTELKKAKELAEQSLQIQEQFLANTSHEIRTPMNGILGMTRQLLETPLNHEQIEYVNAIKESSNNLLHVVNDILDLSKIRAGKLVFEKTEFKIADLFKSLQFILQYKTEEKNIKLDLSIDENIPGVLIGDAFRLNQILLNLASNAIKFTEEGCVTFTAELVKSDENNSSIKFCVLDTGIGIPEDKLEYIFETFAQAESHTTRKYGGTGLGLSISKVLVEELGGKISVTSKVGVGSCFCFELTFGNGDPNWSGSVAQHTEGIPFNADLSNVNILIIEDNVINQRVALFELRKWKVNADIAGNAIIAFEKLKAKNYDLILMDISMPGMDGIEATQFIRNNFSEPIKNIPIIAMTASALQGEKERCLAAGMNDYISKPFNPITLYKKVVEWGTHDNAILIDAEIPSVTSSRKVDRITDLSMILGLAGGDIDYVKEIIRIYIDSMPEYLKELNVSFEKKEWKEVEEHAHKMRAPASYFGVLELKEILFKIESDIQNHVNDNSLEALMGSVNHFVLTSVKELKEELEKID